MKKLLLYIIVSTFIISFASATIELGAFKKSDCIQLPQTCSNCTYVNVSSVTYPNGSILSLNKVMTKIGTDYNYTFCETSTLGNYLFSVVGDKNGVIDTENGNFEITYTGDSLSTQKSILYTALIAILTFFFILLLVWSNKLPDKNTQNEEGEYLSVSWLKYVRSSLLFAAWMVLVAIFYITSNLAFAYLGEVLFAKILFTFFRICFGLTLPIVVIWFIWIFVSIFKDRKVKHMIEKGIYQGGKY
jgi:hypothetical protein